MILSIGEILIDVFPDYQRIGGAPFNFAYHLKKKGLSVRFISRIGTDDAGADIASFVADAGFESSDLQVDRQHPTGHVDVRLDDRGIPEFIIAANTAYDYLTYDHLMGELETSPPRLVYYGSLIQRTEPGHKNLHVFLENLPPETIRLYDMNLRPGATDRSRIARSLAAADIVKLNEEELSTTASIIGAPAAEEDRVHHMMKHFKLKAVAVTRGAMGSALYIDDEQHEITAPDVNVVDTVGAGDAYCAVLASGLLTGRTPDQILKEASRFSGRICAIAGAIPTSDAFYDE